MRMEGRSGAGVESVFQSPPGILILSAITLSRHICICICRIQPGAVSGHLISMSPHKPLMKGLSTLATMLVRLLSFLSCATNQQKKRLSERVSVGSSFAMVRSKRNKNRDVFPAWPPLLFNQGRGKNLEISSGGRGPKQTT